ncbi:hypothetical protein [Rubrobacter indicoceani]|uniref:hypothetical protein n=1 Tax=Rubrobacter indicoceani TaxID=2051957 RepID=UPI001F08DF23|nr:hypothetical protein [Rubrobacter indicoceani]
MKRRTLAAERVLPFAPGFSRRRFLAGGGALLLLGAAGCGGSGGSGSSEAVSIRHKYGTTEIQGRPERVVSVEYTDQDPILAVGGALVGVREWFGGYEYSGSRLQRRSPGQIPSTSSRLRASAPTLSSGCTPG